MRMLMANWFLLIHWELILSKELIITNIDFNGKTYAASALFEKPDDVERTSASVSGKKAVELRIHCLESKSIVGNIYVAEIEKMVKNIGAAFVRIGNDLPSCYLELKSGLQQGKKLIVQVSKDAVKMKAPCVTTNLNFPGKYVVLTTENTILGISAKIDKETKEVLRKWLEPCMDGTFGIVVRTNAATADKAKILEEFAFLKSRLERIRNIGEHRNSFTLLEEAMPFYIEAIRDVYTEDLVQIRTDIPEYYDKIKNHLENYQQSELDKLSFYDDKLVSLASLYSLRALMEDCLRERVWLKSGGFLVIQQTEAFVCIDVNSGKFVGKKKEQETYRKINLEAAEEIARQLRLRNLSGVVLIDFINMAREEHRDELIHVLQKHLRRDPVKAKVIDMTPLQIVEMTRQRVRKPIAEEL